jgi:hypothetical protein
MIFTTETGSTYEINDDGGVPYVRRLNSWYEKRADGEWIKLLNTPKVELGGNVTLVLESLSEYGPDDHGTIGGGATVRRTSRVTEVWA